MTPDHHFSRQQYRSLVTGGGGFIGRHVVAELVKRGDTVRVLHRGETFDGPVEPVLGDVAQAVSLPEAMRGIEVVYHLAGYGSPSTPPEEHRRLIDTNVTGTLNVLRAAAEAGVRRVVLASSASVYGSLSSPALREDMTPQPISAYGAAKLSAEHMCEMASRMWRIQTVALRYFNVYGRGEDPEAQSGKLIPSLLRRLQREEPITLYGDGQQTRDFVHIEDVVRATVLAGTTEISGYQVVNVGSGEGVSVAEVSHTIADLLHKEPVIVQAPVRPSEILHSVADLAHASRDLGFLPRVSFADGIRSLVCGPELGIALAASGALKE